MKKAKVSDLKANLSAYPAEVRNGSTVIVCDRKTPIARLIPYDRRADSLRIQEADRPVTALSEIRPVRLRKKTDIDKVLRETRGGR
jgi:prevent-host-death family protein